MSKFQCPCCDYFSLKRRAEYDICKVCFQEDDGNDLTSLDVHSGPNHMALREARDNFKEFGACDMAMKKNVLSLEQRQKYQLEVREL